MEEVQYLLKVNVLIIGAGPGGLAAAAALQKLSMSYFICEKEKFIGGTYAKTHPSLSLVSPEKLSALPFEPIIRKKSSHPLSFGEYHQYLKSYANKHEIQVELSDKVVSVQSEESVFVTQLESGKIIKSKFVILATGLSSFPKSLLFNFNNNSDVIFETAVKWKGTEYYHGKTVLVLGSGTSATEIASHLASTSKVLLVTKSNFKTTSFSILGIDTHYFLRPFELLPRVFLKSFCNPKTKDPIIDFGIRNLIRSGRIQHFTDFHTIRNGCAEFLNGKKIKIDILINCTGYQFDTQIVSQQVIRNLDGTIATQNNKSLSHPRFFTIGYPCANKVDSKFLRGISRDAILIAKQIKKIINTK